MDHDWSADFNALPYDVRRISSAIGNQAVIRQLEAEKARSLARHKQTMRECNDHIKNCREWLAQLEHELEPGDG